MNSEKQIDPSVINRIENPTTVLPNDQFDAITELIKNPPEPTQALRQVVEHGKSLSDEERNQMSTTTNLSGRKKVDKETNMG